MQRQRVDWSAGEWTRGPATSRLDGDDLVVGASEGSDFWRTTHYGFVHDDGHALLGAWPTDAAVEVTFDTSTLTGLYDQAGLMLFAGDEHWVKAGLEVSDGVLHLGAVVTNGSRTGRSHRCPTGPGSTSRSVPAGAASTVTRSPFAAPCCALRRVPTSRCDSRGGCSRPPTSTCMRTRRSHEASIGDRR